MPTRPFRPFVVALVATASLLLPGLFSSAPADTGTTSVGTYAGLDDAVNSCGGAPARIAMSADVVAPDSQLSASCDVEIDLAGHRVEIATLATTEPALTVVDSVGGGVLAAPIALFAPNSIFAVASGTVEAVGIGQPGVAARYPASTEVVVNGGALVATTDDDHSTALGGEYGYDFYDEVEETDAHRPGGPGFTVTDNNGSLTAAAPAAGLSPAIGGGSSRGAAGGDGGRVTVTGGVLTASGGSTPIGGGTGAPDGAFGQLIVTGGTVHLPSGDLVVPDSDMSSAEVLIGSDGVLGGAVDGSSSAVVRGAGQIYNGGLITMPVDDVVGHGTLVTGNNYLVTFSDNREGGTVDSPIHVLAPSLAAAGMPWRVDPVWAGHAFYGWNTAADGSGQNVTSAHHLPGTDLAGSGALVNLYAQWIAPPPVLAATVTLTGRAQVGRTIRASVATTGVVARSAGPATATWRWFRGAAPIAGATSPSYVVAPADYGKKLTARAVVEQDGVGSAVGKATTGRVGLQQLVLTVDHAKARPGQKVWIVVDHVLPGQRWSLAFDFGRPLASGKAPPDETTAAAQIRLPKDLVNFGKRHLRVTTVGPKRSATTSFVLVR